MLAGGIKVVVYPSQSYGTARFPSGVLKLALWMLRKLTTLHLYPSNLLPEPSPLCTKVSDSKQTTPYSNKKTRLTTLISRRLLYDALCERPHEVTHLHSSYAAVVEGFPKVHGGSDWLERLNQASSGEIEPLAKMLQSEIDWHVPRCSPLLFQAHGNRLLFFRASEK